MPHCGVTPAGELRHPVFRMPINSMAVLDPSSPAKQTVLFRERYSRARFWRRSMLLPVLLTLMLFPLTAMNDPRGGNLGPALLAVLLLPFSWLYCKLVVHRLHDLDRSGWWCLPLTVLPVAMFRESFVVYDRIEQSYAAQQAVQTYVLAMLLGSIAIFIAGFLALGCVRGTEGPNRFGLDPLRRPEWL